MKKIVVYKARSFADAERWDRQFWRRAGAAARFEAMYSMVVDYLKMRGQWNGRMPRLRKDVQRVRYLR